MNHAVLVVHVVSKLRNPLKLHKRFYLLVEKILNYVLGMHINYNKSLNSYEVISIKLFSINLNQFFELIVQKKQMFLDLVFYYGFFCLLGPVYLRAIEHTLSRVRDYPFISIHLRILFNRLKKTCFYCLNHSCFHVRHPVFHLLHFKVNRFDKINLFFL